MLPITQCLLDALPALNSTQPLPPALPDFLEVTALTLLWNT